MRLGVVSDTHDNVAAIERATERFREEEVETLIHCGDFIAPPVLPFFEGFTLHGVLGNNDGEREGLEAGFEAIDGELHGRFAELEFGGKRFAVLHGESKEEVESRAESGEYDYVCYGHHHERERHEVDGTLVINPGAHFPTVPDEHRTVAVLDTETDEVRFLEIEV
ncbi:metallophosphoesterase [Halalkalicoccus salilacus]|uniref:metallophosphoesterase n=1 Tax=Halalkalicoccus TaxID=332246 RepID=UPI002F96ABEF